MKKDLQKKRAFAVQRFLDGEQPQVTADGVTKTYEVNIQWFGDIQDFGITVIIPKD